VKSMEASSAAFNWPNRSCIKVVVPMVTAIWFYQPTKRAGEHIDGRADRVARGVPGPNRVVPRTRPWQPPNKQCLAEIAGLLRQVVLACDIDKPRPQGEFTTKRPAVSAAASILATNCTRMRGSFKCS
jgi:hypothetical protein